jgi:predicted ester cyclase
MTPEQRKQLVRELVEQVTVTGNIDLMLEHPGLVDTASSIQHMINGLSDRGIRFTLQITEGDWVATRAVISGTHTGEGFGVPPTGKTVEYDVLILNRVVEGLVVQDQSIPNIMSLMHQIGVPMTNEAT